MRQAPSASGRRAPRRHAPAVRRRRRRVPRQSAPRAQPALDHAPRAAAVRPRGSSSSSASLVRASGAARAGAPARPRRARAPVPTLRMARRRAPRRAGGAPSRRGRSGRGGHARACPGRLRAVAASTCTPRPGHPAPAHGQRFIVATSWNRAGNSAWPLTRATETTPSSSGCRSASSVGRWNSGSSSRSRTP